MGEIKGDSAAVDGVAVLGKSEKGDGVVGSTGTSAKNGIFGRNDQTDPAPTLIALGVTSAEPGAFGVTRAEPLGNGVLGLSMVPNASGVFGVNNNGGNGVAGDSPRGDGVVGSTGTSAKNGIFGRNDRTEPAPPGKPVGNGVFGFSMVPNASGVFGVNNNGGNGVAGSSSRGFAGFFEGNVMVTGDVQLAGGDCAEEFRVDELTVEPGTVMVIDGDGLLRACTAAYDKRVAGVVSGAGDYKPGIVLGKQNSRANRRPIALLGKVYCKVDATYAPIEVGDLLTTAPTPGHAMKATDPMKAFSAVIGKALRPIKEGQGLVPILIALQ